MGALFWRMARTYRQDNDDAFSGLLVKLSIANPDSLTPHNQQMTDMMDKMLKSAVLDEDDVGWITRVFLLLLRFLWDG
jgi:hypothetical protein